MCKLWWRKTASQLTITKQSFSWPIILWAYIFLLSESNRLRSLKAADLTIFFLVASSNASNAFKFYTIFLSGWTIQVTSSWLTCFSMQQNSDDTSKKMFYIDSNLKESRHSISLLHIGNEGVQPDHHSYWCGKHCVNLGRGQQITDGQRAKKRSHQSQNPASGRQHRKNQERPWRQVQHVGKIFNKYTTQLVRGRNFLYNSVNVLIQGYVFFFNITFNIFIPGVAKLMKTYSGNPSFSNQKNLEETEQQLDEVKFGVCSRSIWVHLTLIAALFNNVVLLLVVFS